MARSDEERENMGNGLSIGQFTALTNELKRLMNAELEGINSRLDRIQEDQQTGQRRAPGGRARTTPRSEESEEETIHQLESAGSQHRPRRDRNNRPRAAPRARPDDNLGGLKLKIPTFYGKNDPDAYLEWEKKIELVFDCQNFSDHKKVRLAATEFCGYAINWWDQVVTARRRTGQRPIVTWEEMTATMRRRFVPSHYHRELHHKLRRLTQGSRNVEDYFQEMESLMLKADIEEDVEATMARFLGGLNRDIQDRLEMQEYDDVEEMLHKAILIEQQNKRKAYVKPSYASNSKAPYQDKGKFPAKSTSDFKTNPVANDVKGKAVTTSTRARDIRCFKCQGLGHYASDCINKKVMVLLDNGDVESEDEQPETPQSKDTDEEEIDYAAQGELLVTRRTLSVQTKPREHEQRENLFHTRCLVQDKVCSLIIDGGSCTNVASETLVQRLGLQVKKHPRPYSL